MLYQAGRHTWFALQSCNRLPSTSAGRADVCASATAASQAMPKASRRAATAAAVGLRRGVQLRRLPPIDRRAPALLPLRSCCDEGPAAGLPDLADGLGCCAPDPAPEPLHKLAPATAPASGAPSTSARAWSAGAAAKGLLRGLVTMGLPAAGQLLSACRPSATGLPAAGCPCGGDDCTCAADACCMGCAAGRLSFPGGATTPSAEGSWSG